MSRIVTLEGTDGSGKTTQFWLSQKKLKEANYQVISHSFPQYDSPASYFVRSYLNKDYGLNPNDVNGKAASVF